MPVSSTLLRPGRVARARAVEGGSDAALAADLVAMAVRLGEDAAAGGELHGALRDALGDTAQALAQQARTGGEAALARLTAWVNALAGPVSALGINLDSVGNPADALVAAQGLLEAFANLAGDLDADALRPHLQVLWDALQVDLGLSPLALENAVWELFDAFATRVRALPPADGEAMERRRETVSVLHRMRKRMRGQVTIPFPTAEQAAGLLAEWLRHSGITGRLRDVACAGKGLADVAGAAAKIAGAVPFGGALSFQSVGAAAAADTPRDQYCWYASWLLDAPVYVNAARTQVRKGDEVIHTGTDVEWHQAPIFQPRTDGQKWYSFQKLGPGPIEVAAYWGAILGYALEITLNLTSLKHADYAGKSLNAFAATAFGIQTIIRKEPLPGWVEWVSQLVLSLGCSVEGLPTAASAANTAKVWVLMFPADVFAMVLFRMVSSTPRDLGLTVFTLVNSTRQGTPADGLVDARPENRRVFSTLVSTVVTGLTKLETYLYPRADYRHPFKDGEVAAKIFLLWMGLINTCFVLTGAILGELLSWAFSGSPDTRRFLHDGLLKLWGINSALFIPNLYMDVEGGTRGGTVNASRPEFAGYPDNENSPYLLPYAKGTWAYVPQGNEGFFSHYETNFAQTYAYDFALDQDEPILAARPGTVVDFVDTVANDDNSGDWNYIVIRHDLDDLLSPLAEPDPVHDLGAGGKRVVTFAVYGHGRTGSVTAAFAARAPAVAAGAIVGTRVKRGEMIMRSGNTGVSFINHLHIHIQQQQGGEWHPGDVLSAAARDGSFTIPFVFREVNFLNPLTTDGVPRTFDVPTSENG